MRTDNHSHLSRVSCADLILLCLFASQEVGSNTSDCVGGNKGGGSGGRDTEVGDGGDDPADSLQQLDSLADPNYAAMIHAAVEASNTTNDGGGFERHDLLGDPEYASQFAAAIAASSADAAIAATAAAAAAAPSPAATVAAAVNGAASCSSTRTVSASSSRRAIVSRTVVLPPYFFKAINTREGLLLLSQEYGVRIQSANTVGANTLVLTGRQKAVKIAANFLVSTLAEESFTANLQKAQRKQLRIFVDASNILLNAPLGFSVDALIDVRKDHGTAV
jgi:hypothetical protein